MILVDKEDGSIHKVAFGDHTLETVVLLASTSKMPTASLLMALHDDNDNVDFEIDAIIDQYLPDIIVLAGFMRILTAGFVGKYTGKLINIHPSLLPLYRGLHTHKRALEDKATQHGASVHFVTPELDSGAVIMQGVVDVKPQDTEESLAQRVHQIEHIIYPQAVKLLTSSKVELVGDDIKVDGVVLEKPNKYYLQ